LSIGRVAAAAIVVAWATRSGAEDFPFIIRVPDGVTVQKTAGRDFDVYYFNKGGVTYAGVYYGNSPTFGDVNGTQPMQQSVECKDRKPVKRDVLLRLGDGQFLHAWDFEDNGQGAMARAILTSIRIPGKNEGVRVADLAPCPR
jgi:hypothetical protein